MGHIQILHDVPSHAEGFSRTVRIFTPSLYDQTTTARFGVVYMQDGQNVFDDTRSARDPTWAANHALEDLLRSGRIGSWIIVAVDHGLGRFEDYSPWDEPRANVKGRGRSYARFLIEQLKPWIDSTYRTLPGPEHTAVVGSSLGGLISLYLHRWHTDVFGRVGALSPSVMWCEDGLFRHWTSHSRQWSRIYVDAGDRELFVLGAFPMEYGIRTREFGEHLRGLGYGEHELLTVLEPGGEHTEGDWQRRLPAAFEWLLR
ncbi:MAG: alpha/beta hydrolase-fold protein [Myxococcaceae bacterium]